MRLAPGTQYRISKRGLVLATPNGETILFEHPDAATLPALLAANPSQADLESALGPALQPGVISDLVDLNILASNGSDAVPVSNRPGVALTRSGIMIPGIAAPGRWLDTNLVPALVHPIGKVVLLTTVVAGAAALMAGRPDVPAASDAPRWKRC